MTLYIGVTNNLARRIAQHKKGHGSAFTSRYHFDRLVYFEEYGEPMLAIEREKQIKMLNRAKKIALIERENPEWLDLAVRF